MARWKIGKNAGGAFRKNGDLWVSHWVKNPKGELQILVTECGFRDTPDGRRKVILDRWIVDSPACGRKK